MAASQGGRQRSVCRTGSRWSGAPSSSQTKTNNPGGVYVGAEFDANNVPSTKPRSYQLPYSDALARKIARAQEKREHGIEVMGKLGEEGNGPQRQVEPKSDVKMGAITTNNEDTPATDTVPFMDDSARLNFEDLPPVVLPDKGLL